MRRIDPQVVTELEAAAFRRLAPGGVLHGANIPLPSFENQPLQCAA